MPACGDPPVQGRLLQAARHSLHGNEVLIRRCYSRFPFVLHVLNLPRTRRCRQPTVEYRFPVEVVVHGVVGRKELLSLERD